MRKYGNVSEVRPGVWRVRISRGYKADGSRRVVSKTVYGTMEDAQAEAQRLAVVLGASPSYGSGMSVDTYFYTVFLPTRNNLKRVTLQGYKSMYEKHVRYRFGDMPLDAITRPMVQAWLSEQPASSARNYFRVLSAVLNGAVDDGCLDTPVSISRLRFPRKEYAPEAVKVWSAEMVAECFERLDGDRIYPLWLAMVGAGLSRSEACALEWADVSRVDRWCVVRVNKALTASDGLSAPKNSYRYRLVPVALPFGDKLLQLAGDGRIWPNGPEYASTWWRRLFGDVLSGLPYVPLNRMRATHETLLQLAGVVDSVNARMHGRSNIQTGYLHYQFPALGAMGEAADAMGEMMGSKIDS